MQDPVAELDFREINWYLSEDLEVYETVIEAAEGVAQKYTYRPLVEVHTASRTPAELTDRCETTKASTTCYNKLGEVISQIATDSVPRDSTLFDELTDLVANADSIPELNARVAAPAAEINSAGRDSLFYPDPQDPSKMRSVVVLAEPKHRIDYIDDTTTQTTYYRFDSYLRRDLPSREFVVTNMTTKAGLPAVRTDATYYSMYYDPNVRFEDLEQLDVVVYPNPASDYLQLRPGAGHVIDRVEIFDALGRRVLYSKAADNRLDISSLARGSYVMSALSADGRTFVTPFKKQ